MGKSEQIKVAGVMRWGCWDKEDTLSKETGQLRDVKVIA